MPQNPSTTDRPPTGPPPPLPSPSAGPDAAHPRDAAQDAARALSADPARVAAARRLRPPGGTLPGLDRIASLAARLLGATSGRISLLSDVQSLVGAAGPQPDGGGDGGGDGGEDGGGEEPLAQWLCTQTAASGEPVAIGDTRTDGRVAGLPPVRSGVVGSYLGAPLTAGDGQVVGAVCVFQPTARAWDEDDVALLQQVAAAAAAELELAALSSDYRANKALLEVAVQAAGIGTFDLDLATGALVWDEQMYALFGVRREEFGEDLAEAMARIHPEDRDRVDADVAAAVRTGVFASAYRVLLPGGATRWLEGRGRTLPDAAGAPARLVGAAHDVSAHRRVTERIAGALESMAVGYLVLDPDWRIAYVNAEAERIGGQRRADVLGRTLWEAFPATVGSVFEERYRRAVATGQPEVFDAHYPEPLDVWVEVRAVPEDEGLALYFLDITARRRAQQVAENAAARAQLLAAVTAELTGTLEAEEAVARLAQLVVPALGDWCVVTLVDDDTSASTPASARDRVAAGRTGELRRGLRDVGRWHHREELRPLVEDYADHRLSELTDTAYLWRALSRSTPVVINDATRAITGVLDPDGRVRGVLARLAPSSAVILPLRGRGRTVGLITVFAGAERAPLSTEVLATATEVAARAGLALDSARLYRQQRDLAEGLQRSLLSDPPEPDHGQIVVRYAPAAEAAQVGGDWYDAFVQPDGATVLVIGDVIGHDTQAAAAMSQVRTVVRTLGALGDDSPARVLAQADRAMANLQITTTATAIAARLEQTPEERGRGLTRLRWSSAGHPPAAVVHPDGAVELLDGGHADLLLGVLPDEPRTDHEVVLRRGATVVLYTDGLVERRDQSLHEGLERLRVTLAELAAEDGDLDSLVDRLLARMLPARPEDDVAVVAVRLHREDRPRPAEAGPRRVPPHVARQPGADGP
ncbi:SpoIIE family protein phosphatase [Kineococcus sp. SYSU DK005]|uniref:SpoIIE family protein phosphatase n=1 Tax=Kineococcus sp. SYSU DK005 TaxID=3383126 RepID=UPI003D7DB3E7